MAVDLSQNYFELFGLPPSFDLDRQQLDTRYRELQRQVHPDRFATASDQERRLSMQHATRINEGYRLLKDPLARARYLLELAGHGFNDEQATHQDPVFLMEQMELREALEEVRGSTDPFQALGDIMDRIGDRVDGLTDELTQAFAAGAVEHAGEVEQLIQRMQFFRKLEQEAEALEADLEDAG